MVKYRHEKNSQSSRPFRGPGGVATRRVQPRVAPHRARPGEVLAARQLLRQGVHRDEHARLRPARRRLCDVGEYPCATSTRRFHTRRQAAPTSASSQTGATGTSSSSETATSILATSSSRPGRGWGISWKAAGGSCGKAPPRSRSPHGSAAATCRKSRRWTSTTGLENLSLRFFNPHLEEAVVEVGRIFQTVENRSDLFSTVSFCFATKNRRNRRCLPSSCLLLTFVAYTIFKLSEQSLRREPMSQLVASNHSARCCQSRGESCSAPARGKGRAPLRDLT